MKGIHHYLEGSDHEDALRLGDRRLMITISLEPPFDDPQLFANPYLLPVLSVALDDDFVLGAFGIVCSLSSAPAQRRHADGGILFPRSGVDMILPRGRHYCRNPTSRNERGQRHNSVVAGLASRCRVRLKEEGIEPVLREGSCMLWDFRLLHAGTPNRGALPRPLLYLTYCRPWYF